MISGQSPIAEASRPFADHLDIVIPEKGVASVPEKGKLIITPIVIYILGVGH